MDKDKKPAIATCPSGAKCVGYDAQDGRRYCCFCGRSLKVKPEGAPRATPWDWTQRKD